MSLRCALIGYGEIGKAVHNAYPMHEYDIYDLQYEQKRQLDEYDLMLVAIPYTDNFVEIVSKYQQELQPKAKIIFSSVAIGTTAKLKNAVHVPIEGKHPDLTKSMQIWSVFMGGYNPIAYQFFVQAGKLPYVLDKSEHTEALKLMSTTNYGVNIEYARYCNEICKDVGMDYAVVNEYNIAYNTLYDAMAMPQFARYILTPPEGAKGGHCVRENSLILRQQYPNALVDIVAEVKDDNA